MAINLLLQYWKIKSYEKYGKETLERSQWESFKEILDHAYSNCPLYKKKFSQAGIKPEDIRTRNDLIKIPVITKEELILSGDDIFAKGYNRQNCFSSRSSGSTGQPFTSYFDRDAWNILKYAAKLRARRACGLKFGARMINIEACSAEEAARMNQKAKELKNLAVKRGFLSVYEDARNHIDFYNEFKPEALYGLGTYFCELIDFVQESKIKWHKPDIVFTSGEMLDQLVRRKLKDYFGNKVYDIYGCSELKEIAWECPEKKGYHINDDLCLVEVVAGEIIVTSLINKAMPLIRFSIGDLGKLIDVPCSCGRAFALMEPTLGRSVDMVTTEDSRKISPYALTMAVENIEGILQYQIVQESKKEITIKIRAGKNWSAEKETEVRNQLKNSIGSNTNIRVQLVNKLEREPNGKFRIVKAKTIYE